MYSHFEKYGLKVAGRTDYTIRSGPDSRPSEIRRGLVDQPDVDTFCIIDDDDFYRWKWLSQYLVITRTKEYEEWQGETYEEWKRTLSDADVLKAIEILNRYNKSYIEAQF